MPFVARWPGKIPDALETDEPITVMDLLPTLAKLSGGAAPSDRVIDGKDIWPLLSGAKDAKSPHDAIYYMKGRSLHGIRVGDWKYRYAVEKPGKGEKTKRDRQASEATEPKKVAVEALYNLRKDIGEQTNLVDDRPEIVRRLKKQMADFESVLRKNLRPAGVAPAK